MQLFKVPIQKDEEQRIGKFFANALNNKRQGKEQQRKL